MLLFSASPPIDSGEEEAIERNHLLVARRGREPGLMLERDGRRVAHPRLERGAARFDAGHLRAARQRSIRSGPT